MKKANLIQTTLVALATAGMFLQSCEKHKHDDDEDKNDHSIPVLNITSPTAMQMFNNGDTVWIKGTLTDNSLHECYISIKNDKDSLLFESSPTVHDLSSYDINTFWKSAVSDHTNAVLKITAEDHNNNVVTDSVKIHIMP